MDFTNVSTVVQLPHTIFVEDQKVKSVKVVTEWDGNISILKVYPIVSIFESNYTATSPFDIDQPYHTDIISAFEDHCATVEAITKGYISLDNIGLTEVFLLYPYYKPA